MAPKAWGKTDMQETLDQFEDDLSGSADFFKFKDGDNEVRLCPAAEGETKPFAKRGQHWRVGDAGKVFNCPRILDEDAPCFLCDKQRELKKSDDEADNDKAEDLYPKKQWLWRIIDPQNPKKGVQVMNIGIKAQKQIAKLMRDKEYGDLTDPVHGINIIIEKSGNTQFNTEYTVRPRRNESDVSDILEANEPPDIFVLCEPATNKAMKAAWNNEASGGPKPEAEHARRRDIDDEEPRTTRARREDPEEDPDDVEPRRTRRAEPEPEDPEPPRRARREEPEDPEPPRRARREEPEDPEPTPKRNRQDAKPSKPEDPDAEPVRGRRISSRSRGDD